MVSDRYLITVQSDTMHGIVSCILWSTSFRTIHLRIVKTHPFGHYSTKHHQRSCYVGSIIDIVEMANQRFYTVESFIWKVQPCCHSRFLTLFSYYIINRILCLTSVSRRALTSTVMEAHGVNTLRHLNWNILMYNYGRVLGLHYIPRYKLDSFMESRKLEHVEISVCEQSISDVISRLTRLNSWYASTLFGCCVLLWIVTMKACAAWSWFRIGQEQPKVVRRLSSRRHWEI